MNIKYQTIAQNKDRLVLKLLGWTVFVAGVVDFIALYAISDNFSW